MRSTGWSYSSAPVRIRAFKSRRCDSVAGVALRLTHSGTEDNPKWESGGGLRHEHTVDYTHAQPQCCSLAARVDTWEKVRECARWLPHSLAPSNEMNDVTATMHSPFDAWCSSHSDEHMTQTWQDTEALLNTGQRTLQTEAHWTHIPWRVTASMTSMKCQQGARHFDPYTHHQSQSMIIAHHCQFYQYY